MAPRDRPADRGARRARAILGEVGRELREARIAAGLTQAVVGRAAGVSGSTVGRVETGRAGGLRIDLAAKLFAVVGMDLVVRPYPAGSPIRDAAHVALLGRARVRFGATFRWRTEVPIALPGDLRSWDGMLDREGLSIGVEAETRLRDVQALLRRINGKRRDSLVNRVVLLVADTHSNRAAIAAAWPLLGEAFPGDARRAWTALGAGRDPGADAVLVVPSTAVARVRGLGPG